MSKASNLKYLELIHDLTDMSQKTLEQIDVIAKMDDYSDVSVDLWHNTLASIKIVIDLQQYVLKKLVEENSQIEDGLEALIRKHTKK